MNLTMQEIDLSGTIPGLYLLELRKGDQVIFRSKVISGLH